MAERHSGFTLIEIIATIVLMGIVAVATSTCASPSPANARADADQLAAVLKYVQSKAIAEERPWQLVFDSRTAYRIGPRGGAWQRIPGTDADQVALRSGNTGPVSGYTVIFDSFGRPVEEDGTLVTHIRAMVITGRGLDNNFRVTTHPQTGYVPDPVRYYFD